MTPLCKPEKNKINKDVGKSKESDFELVNKILQRIHSEIRGMPSNRQIFIGASSGWIFGLLAMKIGRTLALAVGGGLILLQIASDKGYISINWNQLSRTFKKEQDNATTNKAACDNKDEPVSVSNWITKFANFAAENVSLTMGILGGFFIGLAS